MRSSRCGKRDVAASSVTWLHDFRRIRAVEAHSKQWMHTRGSSATGQPMRRMRSVRVNSGLGAPGS